MSSTCLVRFCKNNNYNSKTNAKIVSFHRVPAAEDLRKIWESILMTELSPGANQRICSAHFNDDDFGSTGNFKKLKPLSVPSKFVPGAPTHRVIIKQRSFKNNETFQFRIGEQVVELKLEIEKADSSLDVIDLRSSHISQSPSYQDPLLQDKLRLYKTKNKNLLQKIQDMKRISQKRRQITIFQKEVQERKLDSMKEKLLKKERQRLNLRRRLMDEKVKNPIKCFTPTQIKVLQTGQSKAWWSDEDLSRAIVLKAKSHSAYNYLRNSLNYPLPGSSTLKKYVSNIIMRPGIIQPVMSLLTHQFQDSSDFSKQAVLSFDEMSVDNLLSYDPKNDVILGPHKNIMVVFIRGLFTNWKQPIAYGFDYKIDKKISDQIITRVESTGINVIASVCDLGPNNTSYRNENDITLERTHFENPATGRRIWFFYDTPHLIKRLRDNSLDYTITLVGGSTYSVQDFYALLEIDSNEIRCCYKVTKAHLTVKGKERMNVRKAMELFSGTVAHFLKKYFPNNPRLQRLAVFISTVNEYVDVMNSRDKDVNFTGSPSQVLALKKMESEITGLRVGNSKGLLPFQKGILISIKSILGLWEDVKGRPFNAKFLMTKNLNQDIAENSFSIMRGMGRFYTHPTPLEAQNRLRLTMLGWSLKPSTNGNCESDEPTERPYLTTGLLAALQVQDEGVTEEVIDEPVIPLDEVEQMDLTITHENFSQTILNMNVKQRVEFEAKEYVLGYIVSKLKTKFPQLTLEEDLENRNPKTWTQSASKGNLSLPSYEWLNVFLKFEQYFDAFHFTGEIYQVNKSHGVCRLLSEELVKYFPHIDIEIIKYYVKVRTMLRITSINSKIKSQKRKYANKPSQPIFESQFVEASVQEDCPDTFELDTENF